MTATGNVFHRNATTTPPLAVAGEGIWLIDDAGRRYIDACGGAAVSALGHGHPVVAAAIAAQAHSLEYAHTGSFTSAPAEALATVIAGQCPSSPERTLDRVWFTSSGSEAVEAAIKLARQYHWERGDTRRTRLIARRQSYHGNTLGALAAGGNAGRRAAYAPLLIDVSLIDPCFAYHHAHAGETPQEYGLRAAAALEQELQRLGPDTVIAFIAETVVGATAGAVPPAPGYLAAIRAICDRHGVLLILDEVMCGSGRTGTFLACEAEGVVPDIVTVAKGLGAGYQPIGATVCTAHIHDTIATHSGALLHGQTYAGHPVGCAAALAVQTVIRDQGLLARVAEAGHGLHARLAARLGDHVHVGDIRGRGLLQAIELVANRDHRTPFDPVRAINQRIKAAAFARGLLVYPGSGSVDGQRGDHVLLAPPYVTSDAELDMIVDRLADAIDAVFAGQAAGGAR
ncbi:aspartate aminotransferase family protein [Novosphingobium sp.]|uniref:aspartate aminotransferase family protein n=1 Tax=Novosphingobium sp. TaxID=1874826 RepID=UPI00334187D7